MHRHRALHVSVYNPIQVLLVHSIRVSMVHCLHLVCPGHWQRIPNVTVRVQTTLDLTVIQNVVSMVVSGKQALQPVPVYRHGQELRVRMIPVVPRESFPLPYASVLATGLSSGNQAIVHLLNVILIVQDPIHMKNNNKGSVCAMKTITDKTEHY